MAASQVCKVWQRWDQYKIGTCGSMSSNRKPVDLWPFMKKGLQKKQWRTVYLPEHRITATTLRSRNAAYVNLISNVYTDKAVQYRQRRRKHPGGFFSVNAPEMQPAYNRVKCALDLFNAMAIRYYRISKFHSTSRMYARWFDQAWMTQTYLVHQHFFAATHPLRHEAFRRAFVAAAGDELGAFPRGPNLIHKLDPAPVSMHWPIPLPADSPRRNQVCQVAGCKNKVRYACPACDSSSASGTRNLCFALHMMAHHVAMIEGSPSPFPLD